MNVDLSTVVNRVGIYDYYKSCNLRQTNFTTCKIYFFRDSK